MLADYRDFDMKELDRLLGLFWLCNPAYTRVAPPRRVAQTLRLLQLCERAGGLYLDVEATRDDSGLTRVSFAVASPPHRGFLAQLLEVLNRLDLGVARAYVLDISNGARAPTRSAPSTSTRARAAGCRSARRSTALLEREFFNTQLLPTSSPEYRELVTAGRPERRGRGAGARLRGLLPHQPGARPARPLRLGGGAQRLPRQPADGADADPALPGPLRSGREGARAGAGRPSWPPPRRRCASTTPATATSTTCGATSSAAAWPSSSTPSRPTSSCCRSRPSPSGSTRPTWPSWGRPSPPTCPPATPFRVTFFFTRYGFGYHIGFSDIARGGWRTVICRTDDDFLTNAATLFRENFVLAHTQHFKNKDIYEGGSKLVMLMDASALEDAERDQETIRLHKLQRGVINAFLDIFVTEDGVARDPAVVDYYREDEPIELGPDENMHDEMIEEIAALSQRRGYLLGIGVMSSKQVGINHKEYAVTSTGVVTFAEIAMKELGIDVRAQAGQRQGHRRPQRRRGRQRHGHHPRSAGPRCSCGSSSTAPPRWSIRRAPTGPSCRASC